MNKYKYVDIDVTPLLMEKLGKKTRKIGRYNCSDLYAIKAGWLTPEKFLDGEEVDFTGLMRMLSGIVLHEKIQMLLEKDACEVKVEYPYKDIVLVGKADYLPPESDEVWDFKTSEKIMDKAKPWNNFQIKLYCSMFKKEVGRIYQPIIKGEEGERSFVLVDKGGVERDDSWFQKELENLYRFHLKVVELKEKRERENASI